MKLGTKFDLKWYENRENWEFGLFTSKNFDSMYKIERFRAILCIGPVELRWRK